MGKKKKYQDQELVESAKNNILKIIKPGDVVNQEGDFKVWEFWMAFGSWAIQRFQKKLFGKESNWRDDHSMIYFDEVRTFSVEPPKAKYKPLDEYCLSNLSIYRLQLIDLTAEHIEKMKETAETMEGTDYDLGQLLDIAINQIMGYDHQRRLSIFDFGRKKKVCSVGVRVVFEKLFKASISVGEKDKKKWLFAALNPEKWPPDKLEKYKGTDVEATAPAHFANTDYFCYEFRLIARFNAGEQIYP